MWAGLIIHVMLARAAPSEAPPIGRAPDQNNRKGGQPVHTQSHTPVSTVHLIQVFESSKSLHNNEEIKKLDMIYLQELLPGEEAEGEGREDLPVQKTS